MQITEDLYYRVVELIEKEKMEELKVTLHEQDLVDLVQLMQELDPVERVVSFRLLDKDPAIEVFEKLDINLQKTLIRDFAETEAAETFTNLEIDDRVRLLDELPAGVAKRLINQLDETEREETSQLLGYKEETAGRIMSTDYVRVNTEATVQEAMNKVRKIEDSGENLYNLYVTDTGRKLKGQIDLQKLVLSDPDEKVSNIMDSYPVKVDTDVDQEEAARLLQEQDLVNLPVVDHENRLVGAITTDDAAEIIEEETTEDILEMAGMGSLRSDEALRSRTLIEGSLPQIWKVRIPYLLIALAGGLLAGGVIDGFEETLEAIAAVAVFIPVIMDMGGNVGTQSSTIFARGLVLGHVNVRRFRNYFLKEMSVGATMGIMMGAVAGVVAHFWQGLEGFGLAVGLSMALTITIASSLGFIIPYTLYKLDLDQAAGSDPVITTLKDITALIIYFSLVQVFMGYML